MSNPTVRAALATLGTAALLLAAWLLPALAIVVVWPLLFIVPGWAIVAAMRARLDGAGRLGLAIVASVAISTHLVYWLSLLRGGYGRDVIFVAAALLALPIVLAAWRGVRPPPLRLLRGSLSGLVLAGLAALVVDATLTVSLWRVTPDGITSGGTNWSDLGVHLSIAETLNAGANFPPEVPYFAGVPLTYHWFADFHAAILAEAASLFSIPAMIIQSSVLAGALALIVYSLARRLVRTDARRVAALAAALAIFGGGMGYIRLIGDLSAGLGSPLELIAAHSYDNRWLTEWPYFRIPSVMGTGLLAHRASTAGLPMLIGAILLLVAALPTEQQRLAGWRDRPWLLALAGVMGALLAPFHFFFFPVFPMLALAWVIAGRRLLDAQAPRNAFALLAPYVLAVPFVLAPVLQSSGSGALQLVTFWPSAPRSDGPMAVVFFYLTNLGVPFVLALGALFIAGLRHRSFLAVWIIGLFLVPNVVRFSVVDFDMNKYFQAMWIGVAIAAAWLIRRWPRPALIAVFALSIPSPLLVAGWTATSNLGVLNTEEARAAAWIAEQTPADAVFVTDGWINSPTDAAGRKRLTTFAPYVANLGYRPEERINHVSTIYCGGDASISAELMDRYGATHVIDANRPDPCASPVDFGDSGRFELVYDAGLLIWRLTDP